MKFGEAEVENFSVATFCDKNIGGLDVAVDDVFLMGSVERIGDFDAERDKHFKGDRAMRDQLFERGALQELHRDEGLAVFFADVVDGADVGVIERRGGLSFALESGKSARVIAHILGQEFQRNIATESTIFGFINDSHATSAEFVEHAIVRKGLADELVGADHADRHVSCPQRSRSMNG